MHPWWLAALVLLPPLWIWLREGNGAWHRRFAPELYQKMVRPGGGLGPKTRRALQLAALALVMVALARPVLDRGTIRLERRQGDVMVAFDISRSMLADDIYPNRLAFAKRKFDEWLDALKNTRVGVVGFSSRAFLVAPLTDDYASLKYLVAHMGTGTVSTRGTDMMAPLEVTARLLKEKKQKALLLFTDGGDQKDFSQAIAYAKSQGIKVFVYAVATEKGGVMKTPEGVVRDASGQVVITRLNRAIASLARQTGGAYMPFSLSKSDMQTLAGLIERSLTHKEGRTETIRDRRELFYYPLAVALLLYLMSFSSLPQWRRREARHA
jgi:Ca-activated chloride channel family protein